MGRLIRQFIVVVLCFFFLGILVSEGRLAKDPPIEAYMEAGIILVERFYECLLSDERAEGCDDLFDVGIGGGDEPREYFEHPEWRWTFLRQHRDLFFTEAFTSGDRLTRADFFDRAGRDVYLFNVREYLDVDSTGGVQVVLRHNLSRRSGAMKEIRFPIRWIEEKGEFRIGIMSVNINGIYIDVLNDFERDFDLFEKLGFSSTNNPGEHSLPEVTRRIWWFAPGIVLGVAILLMWQFGRRKGWDDKNPKRAD